MINKIVDNLTSALSGIKDSSTILVSGFGNAGCPVRLLEALIDQGAKNLTIVSNNADAIEITTTQTLKLPPNLINNNK